MQDTDVQLLYHLVVPPKSCLRLHDLKQRRVDLSRDIEDLREE